MTVAKVTLPPVSEAFLNKLSDAFPAPEIRPGFDRDTAIQRAAHREVIDWIKHNAGRETTVTGDPAALRETVMPTGAVVRTGG